LGETQKSLESIELGSQKAEKEFVDVFVNALSIDLSKLTEVI